MIQNMIDDILKKEKRKLERSEEYRIATRLINELDDFMKKHGGEEFVIGNSR